ncbi:MAG: hypothetical protein LBH30_00960 [Prevotellaceae bacterium]|jgi:hypothetical protein|nr:hypothetical protein [Prevotellaceae bacterium]
MKSIFILTVIIALYSPVINAQTDINVKNGEKQTQVAEYDNYYLSDEVSGTDFTFIIDKDPNGRSSYYTIWNRNNVKFFMPLFDSLPTPPLAPGEEEPIGDYFFPFWVKLNDKNQLISSVRDGLGMDIINQFKLLNNDGNIEITFLIELDGTVSEIKFLIDSYNPLLPAIPPEKLYAIECLIKQRVTFKIDQRNWLPNFFNKSISTTIKDL